jgi:MFS transporter, FSR family, fosmidomycin resistance protein
MLPALHAFLPSVGRETTTAWLPRAIPPASVDRIVYIFTMVSRDVRTISLIGIAHGASHYYQMAFVTMLLIVRSSAGLSFTDVGLLSSLFYGVSGLGQTAAGFAVDRFGARPILAGGLATIGLALASISLAHSLPALAAVAVVAGLGNCIFHPADFALINASVNHGRLGRAFSIHGLGGSLGWAAGPAMYFLDSLVGWVPTALIGAIPGIVLAILVLTRRNDLVDHRIKTRATAAAEEARSRAPARALLLQAPILLCFGYFALLSVNTVGIQQFAVPAWMTMFGVTQDHAALCLIGFLVGSAAGMLVGGVFADRVRHHERVAAIGLVAAAALTLPVALQAVTPILLLPLLALAGFAGGMTNPSRDMIVRNATPPGASGKVFGFVYSGLDLGSFAAPPIFGLLMTAGLPAAIFWIATTLYVVNIGIVLMIRPAAREAIMPAAAE